MNAYHGAGGGWNVSPQAYHAYKQKKAQKYQSRNGLQPRRLGRTNPLVWLLVAPFRLAWFLVKAALTVAVLAAIVAVLWPVLSQL